MLSILALLLALPLSLAKPTSHDMCGSKPCTPDMLRIYEGFHQANTPLVLEAQAYSGTCYHVHPNLSAQRGHHGLMVLRSTDLGRAMTFSGLFSFYTETNPYSGKSLLELLDFMDGARRHPVQFLSEEESFVEIPSDSGSNYYWFKLSGTTAYLMSQWDQNNSRADVRIFCELNEKALE